jgi:hypothetical protein
MQFFDRQYRFAAGPAGRQGGAFEVGSTIPEQPTALHIRFQIEKADTETPNVSIVTLWNLNKHQLSILNGRDCAVSLRAGYGNNMSLVFAGLVAFAETTLDGADRATKLELIDGGLTLRDGFVSLSYSGSVGTRRILEDIARQAGVTITFSHNATFATLSHGFSCVGDVSQALNKACASSGLTWQIHNGVLQVKRRGDTMTRNVYLLSPDSGLLGIPKQIVFASSGEGQPEERGWEVEYLLNGAIGVGDFIRLESDKVRGYFRVKTIEMNGDNIEGAWKCIAKIIAG